jgi:hypothetical protein
VEVVAVVSAVAVVAVDVALFFLDVSPPALGAAPDVHPLFPSAFPGVLAASERAYLP